jgi:phage terminase large subunit
MDVKVDIEEEVFNPIYFPLLSETRRFQIIYGSAGAGKSYFVAQRIVFEMLTQPKRNWLVVRKVARTIRQSVYAQIVAIIGEWGVKNLFECKINHILCENGSEAVFIGIDEPEKIKSITCANGPINGIWAEETTELTEYDFVQLNLRLRGITKVKKIFIMTFNPVSNGATHWIKEKFFTSKKNPNLCIVKVNADHNQHCDADYKQQLQELSGVFRTIYYLGDWATITGDIYSWKEAKELPNRYERVFYGLDFGYTNNETAIVRVYELIDGGYVVEELVYGKKLGNKDIIRLLAENDVSPADEIYADSAEPKSIDEICEAGYNVHPAEKGRDSVLYGIQYLKSQDISIIGQNLINESSSYSWKKDKDMNSINVPVKHKDHLMDATRYAITSSVGSAIFMMSPKERLKDKIKPITAGYRTREY